MKRFIKPLCILFVIFAGLNAQDVDYSGTSAANFLKIGVSARQMAMGEASIAVVKNATALYWNPAASTRIENTGAISISSMNWLVDTRLSYISSVFNLKGIGHVGVDLQYLDYGEIEETTIYDQDGTNRFYSAHDVAIGLGYARKLTNRFSFGIKLKYIAETLANAQASAFAMDIGADFQTSFFNNNFRIAAALSNFGTKMNFTGRDLDITYVVPGSPSSKQIPANLETLEWDIPLLFRFGISNYFIKNENISLLAAYDILDSRDYDVRHNLGIEAGYKNLVYLRGGYKFNYDQTEYTAGFGLDFSQFLGYNVCLDYAFLDYGVFDTLNQFSFSLNF